MADDARVILKQYQLCRRCFERHGGTRAKPASPCYVCRGLMEDLDPVVEKIKGAVNGYEFDTFLIGATLPTQIYEREDALRARLKIRGRESSKNQLTRELGMQFARMAKKKVEYTKPDVMISLVIDKENHVDVSVKSRPLAVAGRYVKKARGMPQKQDRCANCEGKGCDTCNHSGLSGYGSVESVLAKGLMEMTGGQSPKFSWIGSEDQSSLVLGRGRPFYARISNPKKRRLKKKRIAGNGVQAAVSVINEEPELQPRFRVRTKIHVKCGRALTRSDVKGLNSLAGAEVSFENKWKTATKKIHSASVKKIDGTDFALTIVADGGLMIKQFVGGEEYMKPNVSEVMGSKCECVTFDILDVAIQ